MKSLFQRLSVIFFVAAMALSAGCTRIATGEAGVRVNMNIVTFIVGMIVGGILVLYEFTRP